MSTAVKIIQSLCSICHKYDESIHTLFNDSEARVEMVNTVEEFITRLSFENQKLQHQLEIQTKRVENLKKSNEFYANRKSWRKQTQTTNGLIVPEDQWDGKFKIGGKLARSCQAIDQELEKQLEGVK